MLVILLPVLNLHGAELLKLRSAFNMSHGRFFQKYLARAYVKILPQLKHLRT